VHAYSSKISAVAPTASLSFLESRVNKVHHTPAAQKQDEY